MSHTSMVHVRVDDDVRARAAKALGEMGLSTSDAVRLLFHRIAADQAFPLELKVPNTATRAAIVEARELLKDSSSRFNNADALFESLPGGG